MFFPVYLPTSRRSNIGCGRCAISIIRLHMLISAGISDSVKWRWLLLSECLYRRTIRPDVHKLLFKNLIEYKCNVES